MQENTDYGNAVLCILSIPLKAFKSLQSGILVTITCITSHCNCEQGA